ncbi:hypothetical protein NSS71_08830 [Niallia sp. FSL W8-0951]|uniref:hypothetical protein n=1 Tax=Niallia sp. FSL W8-0951 TaxID=2954639 RepID=UPI0030FCFEDD
MTVQIGSGFMGAEDILTSTENIEIVPPTDETWINVKFSFYKFSFKNYQDCHIVINGSRQFREAGQGFTSNEVDPKIYSFKIEEPGIQYIWSAAY